MRMLEGFRFGVRQGNPHRARCRLRGRLRLSPGVPSTSEAEGTADENPRKRKFGRECRLLRVDRTWRGGGRNFSY